MNDLVLLELPAPWAVLSDVTDLATDSTALVVWWAAIGQ